jgi:hypothetical protein
MYSERVAKNVSVCTRVVHDNDIVPSMPTVSGYAHLRQPLAAHHGGRPEADTARVWKKPADGWWFEMRARFARLLSSDGISDHIFALRKRECGGDRKAERKLATFQRPPLDCSRLLAGASSRWSASSSWLSPLLATDEHRPDSTYLFFRPDLAHTPSATVFVTDCRPLSCSDDAVSTSCCRAILAMVS